MKSGLSSRTNVLHLGGALAGIVFAVAAAIAPGKVSAELAEAVAALLLLVFAGAGGYLKADDRKKVGTLKEAIVREIANAKVTVGPPVEGEEMPIPRKPTAGELLDAKAAKAAAKIGAGLMLAIAFAGCSSAVTCPTPIRIDAERDTPTGAPMVAIRCGASVLWRQPCPDPEVTAGRLLCGGADAGVALPLEVTRG
jgi:hypothetical protein